MVNDGPDRAGTVTGRLPPPIASAAGTVAGRLADFVRAVHSPWFGAVEAHTILRDTERHLGWHLGEVQKKRSRGKDLNARRR